MTGLSEQLDWEVKQLPIYNEHGEPIEGYKRIINDRSLQTLSVCKDSYTPTPNERLLQMVDTLEEVGFRLEGFASFKGGRRVLAYLESTDNGLLAGLQVQNYMIVGNAHDGSSSFFTGLTNFIFRCENMFSSTEKQTRVYHTKGHEHKLEEASHYQKLFYEKQQLFHSQMEGFARIPINGKVKDDFIGHVLQIEGKSDLSTRMENIRLKLDDCIATETEELGGSLFGLFNGATRYTTHELNSKHRIFGNPFGHPQTINSRAMDFCEGYAEEYKPAPRIPVLPRHQYF